MDNCVPDQEPVERPSLTSSFPVPLCDQLWMFDAVSQVTSVSVQATLSGAIFHVEGRGHPLQEDVSVKIQCRLLYRGALRD